MEDCEYTPLEAEPRATSPPFLANRLAAEALDMTMLTPIGGQKSRARVFQEEQRKAATDARDRAFEAGRGLLRTDGRRRWILPSEFIEAIAQVANVDYDVAQSVADNLETLGEAESLFGKGIRNPAFADDFDDSVRVAILPQETPDDVSIPTTGHGAQPIDQ